MSPSNRSVAVLVILAGSFCVVGRAPAFEAAARASAGGQAPSAASPADGLIEQARELGLRSIAQKDDDARKRAKKNLEQAEKLLKDELKRDSSCERCLQALAAVYFYDGYFKFGRFDDCIKFTAQALARFPQNGVLAFYNGYAHFHKGEFPEAARALNHAVSSGTLAPDVAAQVKPILETARQQFLTTWYHQADFFQSKESRVEIYNPKTFRNETLVQITPDVELGFGQQGFTQLTSAAPVLRDPDLAAYLNGLVGRLVQQSPSPSARHEVTVLDAPDVVNAVTVPGHVIVYSGLLRFADSEAELAGVLSHELAHNYAHHGARRIIKAYQGQAVANAFLQGINPQNQAAQAIGVLAARLGVGLFLNAYSRFEEKEADLYGSHILFNAGYNPTAMSTLFLKMYRANPKRPVKFLSTHPPLDDRVDYLTEYLESFPLDRELRADAGEAFQRIKARYPGASQAVDTRAGAAAAPAPVGLAVPSALPPLTAAATAPSAPVALAPSNPIGTSGASSPAGPIAAGASRPLGTWASPAGDLWIELRETNGVVDGAVARVPASWPSAHVKAGDIVFLNGRADGSVIRGRLIEVAPRAECPLLEPRFSPTTLQFERSANGLIVTVDEHTHPSCVWSDPSHPKTSAWRRVR